MFQVICNEGDEVILPAPYWVSYLEQIKLAGGIPKVVQTTEKDGFKLTPEALESAISSKSKILLINSPSNPTGAVYTKAELEALGDVILKHKLIVFLMKYMKSLSTIGRACKHCLFKPKLSGNYSYKQRSKSYAMTGWEIGYAAGPGVIKAVTVYKAMPSNPNSIAVCSILL